MKTKYNVDSRQFDAFFERNGNAGARDALEDCKGNISGMIHDISVAVVV